MPTKNIYLDQSLIDWIDKQRAKQGRSFSNYIVMLIRERQEKKRKGNRSS